MGAVVNSNPELWGAVVAHVPFVDVLATMLDATLPLTPGEWPEWGNPIEDREAFELIQSYSPYDNVRAQPYPPMLVTAGLNDPRVTYWEPAKWVARLRELKTDDNELLLKTNMGAGHGGKSGRFESLHETAEEMAFILWQMGVRLSVRELGAWHRRAIGDVGHGHRLLTLDILFLYSWPVQLVGLACVALSIWRSRRWWLLATVPILAATLAISCLLMYEMSQGRFP